jgi:RND family efflux transporter MFP subunit
MTTSPILITATLAALTLIAGCRTEPAPGDALPAARVTGVTAGTTNAPQEYVFSGTLEGARKVTLSTKLMGRITSLPYDIGSRVAAGQVVLRVNSGDVSAKRAQIKAAALEAEAAFGNAGSQYERIKSLYATQSASRKEMDDAEMMYRMASAKVDAVKEMESEVANALEYGDLRSPIDGVIVGRMAQEGDMASPGMPLVVVEDASAFTVVARVPESDIASVAQGDPVRITVDAHQGDFDGRVTQINPAADPSSRQFVIKIAVAKAAGTPSLRSGMHARVALAKGTAPALFIPSGAIIRRGELDGIFVLGDNGTAVLRWVRTGNAAGATTEILSGLRSGETVLVAGTASLRDGQRVEVAR